MPCYQPTRVLKRKDDLRWDLDHRHLFPGESVFNVPCRDCLGCRRADARHWSIRCFHESLSHTADWTQPITEITTELPNSSVITLTYNDEHLPKDGALRHDDFTRFMKRLRNHRTRKTNNPDKVRFFMCGEYGGKTARPHFHAIIYGHSFDDQYSEQSRDGQRNNMSFELDHLWQQKAPGNSHPSQIGRATVDNFSFAGAAYVAGYVAKKSSADIPPGPMEELTDTLTGNVRYVPIAPEYRVMSVKDGLAHKWLTKNRLANLLRLYETDSIQISKWSFPCPRYYDTLLERYRPELMHEIKQKRALATTEYHAEWTQERCSAAEAIALSDLQLRRDSL